MLPFQHRQTLKLMRAAAFSVAAIIGFSSPATAFNGDTYVVVCENCSAVYEFELKGLQTAEALVMPGTYLVTSAAYPRSAYVRVTGHPTTHCDNFGECNYVLENPDVDAVTATGNSVSGTAQLEQIDESIFSVSREQRVPPVTLSAEYQASFVHSSDEEVGPGISQALIAKGINPGLLPIGTRIVVTFQDGTRAIFIKVSNSTLMWLSTGIAWDKNGNPIDRNGASVQNPNTSGFGGGQGAVSGLGSFGLDGSTGSDYRFELASLSMCAYQTIVIFRGNIVFTSISYQPC